jgi:hypothetical protein
MIRRGYYSCNNFQDSNKRKTTEITLGYLPRVLFFNAFELGAESANQVISSDEALGSTDALCLPFLPFLTPGKT